MSPDDIVLEDLTVGFGRSVVAGPIDDRIPACALTLVTGPNGSGKTTLVRTIAGLLEPRSGRVALPDSSTLTYVPQVHAIDPGLPVTAHEVVALGAPAGRAHGAAVGEALESVGAGHLSRRRFSRLSGGQTRRVLVARALICEATILLLDEPTAGIDPDSSASLWRLFRELADSDRCVVAVTHDRARAVPMADHEIVVGSYEAAIP